MSYELGWKAYNGMIYHISTDYHKYLCLPLFAYAHGPNHDDPVCSCLDSSSLEVPFFLSTPLLIW